jgi:transcriptional regulator with GAF, ATPase, and Fis domain
MAPANAPSTELAPPGWERVRVAGTGASATVVQVRATKGGALGALKLLGDVGLATSEARTAFSLRRRWGPALLDAGRAAAGAWVLFEWEPGRALVPAEIPAAERAETALVVAHGVGRGLAELHAAGVRHGDVKPANVLLRGRVPKRDGASERGATLVDLGLATSFGEGARGGTARYASPELRTRGEAGPAADLWALGVVLAEIAGAAGAAAADPLAALGSDELAQWIRCLVAPSPGARMSARELADRAARKLGLEPDPAEGAAARRMDVARAYVAVRSAELARAAGVGDVQGAPRAWLEEALRLERRLAGPAPRGAPELGPLSAIARQRFLVMLVGPVAATFGAGEGTDAQLVERLFELADAGPLGAVRARDLRRSKRGTARWESARGSDRDCALALELERAAPDPRALALVEARIAEGEAPPTLALLFADAAARAGELARAALVLASIDGPEARVVHADVRRRMGDRATARSLAEAAAKTSPRARAILARMAWDDGDDAGALRILADDDGPDAAEVRGLVAWRSPVPLAAEGLLERAALECGDSLARSRLDGVRGFLLQRGGRVVEAMRAIERAVDGALRAGAMPEEAAMLVTLASAAADAGDVGVALASATRGALLLDGLQRRSDAARAWLARAGALATVGAQAGADDAATEALRRSDDPLLRAYARLAQVETRAPGDEEALGFATEALAAVRGRGDEAELRVAARALVWAPGVLSASAVADLDARAATATPSARLEWLGARARTAGEGESRGALLSSLLRLAEVEAPLASRGPALAAARDLAMALADGEAARRFETLRRELAGRLKATTPAAYAEGLSAVAWTHDALAMGERFAPAQVAELETIVRALGERSTLRALLTQVLDSMVLWVGVERGLLLLRAPDGRLVPRAARNIGRSDLSGEQRALSMTLAKRAMESGEPVVATDAFDTLGDLHASVHALRLRSVVAAPLVARGETLGVVYLDDRARRGAVGARELAWVRMLATQAALAIADARDQVLLRRAARRAERAKARLERLLEERETELGAVREELSRVREDDRGLRFSYDAIAGRSEPMQRLLRVVDRVTSSDVPVLLSGESGTGKELIARALHQNGPRAKRSFVSENCGAVPEALLESTLFGHLRGSFTGASQNRPGLFDLADGGTLFLDEIGEMPLAMQAKLLRVLQDGEVRPIGADRSRRVDVRLIAATHRDLEAMVAAKAFREDLFYRLNVVQLRIPPLRERTADIPLIVQRLAEKHAPKRRVRFTRAALDRLVAFPWPGNVRQLENEVRRAIVLGAGEGELVIDVSDLSPEVVRGAGEAAREVGLHLRSRVDELEKELLSEALAKTDGNQTKAAEMLGLSRFGLQKMMKRLKLVRA